MGRADGDPGGVEGRPLVEVLADDIMDDVSMPLDTTMHVHSYQVTGRSRRYMIGTPPACMEYERACTCGDSVWTKWHGLGPTLQKQAQGAVS